MSFERFAMLGAITAWCVAVYALIKMVPLLPLQSWVFGIWSHAELKRLLGPEGESHLRLLKGAAIAFFCFVILSMFVLVGKS